MSDIEPGQPYPLGATWDGQGVNFALASEGATEVLLCLFDGKGREGKEVRQVKLTAVTDGVWHGRVPGLKPGQLYGYRVNGPYEPERGLRFNGNKVLLDPYTRAVGRDLQWNDDLFGYRIGDECGDLSFNDADSAAHAPLAVVVDERFDWGDDHPPRHPWPDTIIYEAHVRGLTQQHPAVPSELQGTYMGVAHEAVIAHLRALGVTAIELLPVQHRTDDRELCDRSLNNYWGYNTLGFFAPDSRYSASNHPAGSVRDFKQMVRALHAANFEVILDVVYNHTPEGNENGPTLSWRGIDNTMYYRLADGAPRYYHDYTGCGNTLNAASPRAMQMIMDSLRYWVTEMHVDGFRFDLAASLSRGLSSVGSAAAFFDIVRQDPVLSQVKLIAEPWDNSGNHLGHFPVGCAEWNGHYRDAVRRFWRGDAALAPELATRIAGSADLYQGAGRSPYASINFVTAHDGFTLADLVSYERKHNELNGSDNSDGTDDNFSWNCGVEGDTDDPEILALRLQHRRNLFATLVLSQGVPMIRGGDELGQSQQGNNNAYCQDNALSWLNWELSDTNREFLEFCQAIVRLSKQHPAFRRRRFFNGADGTGARPDVAWRTPAGAEMDEASWSADFVQAFAMEIVDDGASAEASQHSGAHRDAFVLLFNASCEPIEFQLNAFGAGRCYEHLVDTSVAKHESPTRVAPGAFLALPHSLHVLREIGDEHHR